MNSVLIIDVETNGLDPNVHDVIEVGCVLWSLKHRTMLECYSGLLAADHNEAFDVNGISAATLKKADLAAWGLVADLRAMADALVAHNAEFDKSFCTNVDAKRSFDGVWICTIEDFEWPKFTQSKSLVNVALAHGVGVVAAHRAINDCLILTRLFEAIEDSSERLERALEHAKLPKARVVAKVSYDDRHLAKQLGFHWDPDRKEWWRKMAIEDAKQLPFKTKVTDA